MESVGFDTFFRRITATHPHRWQDDLAAQNLCVDRQIRIPTGFGKTFGVLGAWLWHRHEQADEAWPRRLVWCLPMRVLVEQTEAEVRAVLSRMGKFWDGESDHAGKVGVHVLMGGVDAGDWHLHPERHAVLIGTQDMLLSRALNRGYGAPRARWPMEFGLLNHDCLWVMDEVQLMDVGLATSGQLQAFRGDDHLAGKALRPCRTWWMSATLQPAWLTVSPDTQAMTAALANTRIEPATRHGHLWDDVNKSLRVEQLIDARAFAARVAELHAEAGNGVRGPTIAVLNRVEDAVAVYSELKATEDLTSTDLKLVHSRFRPHERRRWRQDFLNRGACAPNSDRIIIATQVIEAGVDISAGVLVTQLAPWSSLVQRFGRAARWGGSAPIIVIDLLPSGTGTTIADKDRDKLHKARESAALPYALADLDAARSALALLDAVAPAQLEAFEEAHPKLLPELYPYAPRHLLLRHELDELFDTTPDLSGADVDISRFIRSGEERDLQVFWLDLDTDQSPSASVKAARDALCAVPVYKARDWLCGKETKQARSPRLKSGVRAWVWDYLDGHWKKVERKDLYPGQTVLIAAGTGGYDPDSGWDPTSKKPVATVANIEAKPEDQADASEDDESLSAVPQWQTIATHGAQVGRELAGMAQSLGLGHATLLDLAGRWHDAGKALSPFQDSIAGDDRPLRRDLAKAPKAAWLGLRSLYPDPPRRQRHGYRHELASTLALFAVLMRHQPDHPALLGPWRGLLQIAGMDAATTQPAVCPPNALEQEILALDADQFDLLAYLVCSHHGKVRMAWHASPADQAAADSVLRLRGVRDGEVLPALPLAMANGSTIDLPASELRLDAAAAGLNPRTGRGWTERVLGLLHRHGPFALAYQEALLRAADQRASRNPVADPLLSADNAAHGLETSDQHLAQVAGGRESPSALAAHSSQRGSEHGLRGRAGKSDDAGSGTRAPAHATRTIETSIGRLSYVELAPRLALEVALVERAIESGDYDERQLDDALIHDLHRHVCATLVPAFVGWRRIDVVIGSHTPPPFYQVPVAIREYANDLAARLAHLNETGERLLELLAFAEGRLLSVHPFADFNGRAARLFLRLLLRRLDLPAIDLVPATEEAPAYLAALAAGDHADWAPLIAVWRQRFEKEA